VLLRLISAARLAAPGVGVDTPRQQSLESDACIVSMVSEIDVWQLMMMIAIITCRYSVTRVTVLPRFGG